jgi:hypothetical protein
MSSEVLKSGEGSFDEEWLRFRISCLDFAFLYFYTIDEQSGIFYSLSK